MPGSLLFSRLNATLASAAALVLVVSLFGVGPASAAVPLPASPQVAVAPAQAWSASVGAPADTGIRKTADLSMFQAGNIISDSVFFDSGTMAASQIDSFFRSKVKSCQSGYTCLKDYVQNTPNRASDAYCDGYSGAAKESAATIIYRVAQSCGINPQVLIVMLEKEQSLVTHTWPSPWRYDMALGQGCPDTAPCDPAYAGFFYQIYGAARQMQIYAEGRWFTYYAPGKTWNIQYHPNRGCGTSPVHIQNTATAALYYYTPYQPNRAALAAGYGVGDACSSYGNRNFFQLFTDWYGSTTGPRVLRSRTSEAIYLVSGTTKFHIQTVDDLRVLTANFGAFRLVSQSTIDGLAQGGPATRAVRDPRNGVIYLLEADGTKHRFRTVDSMSQFGYPTAVATNMPAEVLDAFTSSAEVGTVFRSHLSPDVYLASNGSRRHVYDQTALAPVLGEQATYVATIADTALRKIPVAPTYFGPQRLIRTTSRDEVYLTTPTPTLIHVPSMELAADFGARQLTIVSDVSVAASSVAKDKLSPVVQCGPEARILDGSALRVLTNAQSLSRTVLTAADCAALPVSSRAAVAGPVFIAEKDSTRLFAFDGGVIRHVWSYQDLLKLNEGATVRTVTWSASAQNAYGVGTPLMALEGSLLRFSGTPEVYKMESGKLRHIVTADTLAALYGSAPAVDVRPLTQKSSFTIGLAILRNGSYVRFGETSRDIYVMKGDQLHRIETWSTLLSLSGDVVPPVSALGATTRGSFVFGAPILKDGAYVRFAGDERVYVMQSGHLRHIETYATLVAMGSGKVPLIDTLDSGRRADYSIGAPIP